MTEDYLILASASPRRRQLLELIGMPFRVCPAEVEEAPRPGEAPTVFARRAARDKALEVAGRAGLPVLGADTVVEVDGTILGKPGSNGEAEEMLRALSGREHQVHTAVALAHRSHQLPAVDERCHDLVDTATVEIVRLSDRVIRWYVATGEPMDKAGAYAIQGLGGLLVSAVEGSPHTVVGLPIHRLPELFAACGLDFWSMLDAGYRSQATGLRR